MPVPYAGQDWRHGWIPITPEAARKKNHDRDVKPGSRVVTQMIEGRKAHADAMKARTDAGRQMDGLIRDRVRPRTPEGVEKSIRGAYADAGKPGSYIRLSRIRDRLPGVPRPEIDAALRRMDRHPDIELDPEVNRKTLSDADRAGAVTIGGDDKHVLRIAPRRR